MAFCPKCKHEYREGFTFCSDCKVNLVESLESIKEFEEKITEEAEAFEQKAEENMSMVDLIDENVLQNLDLDEDKMKKIMENPPTKEEVENLKKFIIAQRKLENNNKEYVSSSEKAKDNKSTGIFLLVLGILGIAFVVLILVGVIPYHISGLFSYIMFGVLIVFFGFFVYFGISSLLKVKELKAKIEDEEASNNEFEEWFKNTISKSLIDGNNNFEGDPENAYFVRHARTVILAKKQFPDINEAYVDEYFDEQYDIIFK